MNSLLASLSDPNYQRGSILPMVRDKRTGQRSLGLPQMAVDVLSALMLPGDVYKGNVLLRDPETGNISDEVIKRSADLAGAMTLGSGAIPAERNTLRMGIKSIDDARRFTGSADDLDYIAKELADEIRQRGGDVSIGSAYDSPQGRSIYIQNNLASDEQRAFGDYNSLRISDHGGGFGGGRRGGKSDGFDFHGKGEVTGAELREKLESLLERQKHFYDPEQAQKEAMDRAMQAAQKSEALKKQAEDVYFNALETDFPAGTRNRYELAAQKAREVFRGFLPPMKAKKRK